ncbi:hypothetical protein ABIC94_000459 [Variovorax paradoxus]
MGCAMRFVQGTHPPTGDIRGGEYPVAFARALNNNTPNKGA